MAKRNTRRATPRALVVVSDIHAGCQMGLCPPRGVRLDGNGRYLPNVVQRQVYAWWREFWDEFVPDAVHHGAYDVLVNGDLIDNEHHGVKSLISNNIEVQRRIAVELLEPVAETCRKTGGRVYVVRGTEAHDGGSGQDVEAVARAIGAVPDGEGRYARWELWKQIAGPNTKCLVHALHHIGTAGSAHYETSAPHRELTSEFIEACQSGEEPPMFCVRSHRHAFTSTPLPCNWGTARSIVTPGWQAKTSLAHKVAGARVRSPEFGGVVMVNGDSEAYFRPFVKRLARGQVEA